MAILKSHVFKKELPVNIIFLHTNKKAEAYIASTFKKYCLIFYSAIPSSERKKANSLALSFNDLKRPLAPP